ncbi:unnamed protein product, partial [Ectocarpus sp. 12 AP-2014]
PTAALCGVCDTTQKTEDGIRRRASRSTRVNNIKAEDTSHSRNPASNATPRSGETMLRAKSLPEFLEQANTDGMRATMLLQADGALQGAAGKGITALHGQIMGVVSTAM